MRTSVHAVLGKHPSYATCSVVVRHSYYAITDMDKGYGHQQEGEKEEVSAGTISCLHICPEVCTIKKNGCRMVSQTDSQTARHSMFWRSEQAEL